MKHLSSKALYTYWNALRGHRAAPLSQAVDQVAIAPLLADMVFVDIQESRTKQRPRLTIRLSGTRVDAIFGRALAGTQLLSLWQTGDQPLIEDLALTVVDRSQAIVAGCAAAPSGCIAAPVEVLLLPLRTDGSSHMRMIGTMSLAQPASWLGLRAAEPLRLKSERLIDPLDTSRFGDVPVGLSRSSTFPIKPAFTVVEGGRSRL